jgi:hypothetical protein
MPTVLTFYVIEIAIMIKKKRILTVKSNIPSYRLKKRKPKKFIDEQASQHSVGT